MLWQFLTHFVCIISLVSPIHECWRDASPKSQTTLSHVLLSSSILSLNFIDGERSIVFRDCFKLTIVWPCSWKLTLLIFIYVWFIYIWFSPRHPTLDGLSSSCQSIDIIQAKLRSRANLVNSNSCISII